ncbi:MAG: hypothetical protein IPJ81_16785 [Chitinophagaceae bacterium]|nr:hypothetical protein [Chitinophagaceae bacterium]
MYKTITSLAMFTATIILIACKQQTKQNPASNIDTIKTPKFADSTKKITLTEADLASKKDLVCGMPAFRFMKDTTIFNKKIFAFCSKECKDEFLKNPKGYITKTIK